MAHIVKIGDKVEIETRHWGRQVGVVVSETYYAWCIGASTITVRWPHATLGHVDSSTLLIGGNWKRL